MSERKTTEFKMRVAESDKASWQLAAEEEGIGLSEFARRAMNDRARHNAIGGLVEFMPPPSSTPEGESSSIAPDFWTEDVLYPSPDVPTSGDVDFVSDEPKPWTFEARKHG